MAIITCWAAKGGSGTTVVVAGLALSANHPSVIVDLAGDQAAVLGLTEPPGQGLAEWFASDAPPAAIVDLGTIVDSRTSLVHRGARSIRPDADRWDELAGWMASDDRLFVVDAGTTTCPPPALMTALDPHDDGAVTDLLVTRPCYLSLRRAHTAAHRPAGVILVNDGGHALGRNDVARSLGSPVVAELGFDPAIARAVDAGLLVSRVPGNASKLFRRVVALCGTPPTTPRTSRMRLTA